MSDEMLVGDADVHVGGITIGSAHRDGTVVHLYQHPPYAACGALLGAGCNSWFVPPEEVQRIVRCARCVRTKEYDALRAARRDGAP